MGHSILLIGLAYARALDNHYENGDAEPQKEQPT